jgi:hypothetical protein
LLACLFAAATAGAGDQVVPGVTRVTVRDRRSVESDDSVPPEWSWWRQFVTLTGDLRAALAVDIRDHRDRTGGTELVPRLRLRGGFTVLPTASVSATARLAAFFDKDADGLGFRLAHRRTIRPGDVTFDSLFVTLRPHGLLTIRVGRLQTQFEIDSVVRDSLSRNDSGGLEVTWTDGAHLEVGRPGSVRLHLIGQLNPKEGPTNGVGARGPIAFDDDASRVTYYAALEVPRRGRLTQLVTDVTIIPEALRPEGLRTSPRESAAALTLKAAADFPLRDEKNAVVLHPFLEVGAMLTTPRNDAVGVSTGADRAGRFALVAGMDLKHLGPGDLGIQCGWIEAGYLISPDYPNNTWSIEARYKVGLVGNAVLEARYRRRQEIDRLVGAPDREADHNILVRITLRY